MASGSQPCAVQWRISATQVFNHQLMLGQLISNRFTFQIIKTAVTTAMVLKSLVDWTVSSLYIFHPLSNTWWAFRTFSAEFIQSKSWRFCTIPHFLKPKGPHDTIQIYKNAPPPRCLFGRASLVCATSQTMACIQHSHVAKRHSIFHNEAARACLETSLFFVSSIIVA